MLGESGPTLKAEPALLTYWCWCQLNYSSNGYPDIASNKTLHLFRIMMLGLGGRRESQIRNFINLPNMHWFQVVKSPQQGLWGQSKSDIMGGSWFITGKEALKGWNDMHWKLSLNTFSVCMVPWHPFLKMKMLGIIQLDLCDSGILNLPD